MRACSVLLYNLSRGTGMGTLLGVTTPAGMHSLGGARELFPVSYIPRLGARQGRRHLGEPARKLAASARRLREKKTVRGANSTLV